MQNPHDLPFTLYKANTFMQRLRGLLGRTELREHEALHISPCADVHSFGMKYAIDVVFLGDTGEVLKTGFLKPNSWLKCKGAESVVEFKAGYTARHGIAVGDSLNTLNSKAIGERNEH